MQNRDLTEFVEYIPRSLPQPGGVSNLAFVHEDLPPQSTLQGDGVFIHRQFHSAEPLVYLLGPSTTPAGLGGLQTGQFVGQALANPELNQGAGTEDLSQF